MDKVIYFIERISSRFDMWENKYKLPQIKVLEELKKVELINDEDKVWEYIEDELEGDLQAIIGLICDTSFHVCEDGEGNRIMKERIKMVENGEGSIDYEESNLGFGLSPKSAILNLVDIDEEW